MSFRRNTDNADVVKQQLPAKFVQRNVKNTSDASSATQQRSCNPTITMEWFNKPVLKTEIWNTLKIVGTTAPVVGVRLLDKKMNTVCIGLITDDRQGLPIYLSTNSQ